MPRTLALPRSLAVPHLLLAMTLLLLTPSLVQAAGRAPALLDPTLATETAPERFAVKLVTTKGAIVIDVTRAWAPLGADRFYNLVRMGFFDNAAFFRVLVGFAAQVGIHGDPAVNAVWGEAVIPDDPVVHGNTKGTVAFAMAGPGTRTTQLFISLMDNSRLDASGFAAFGEVRDSKVADALYGGYGEGAPSGKGPNQGRLQAEGDAYLKASFPKLDRVKKARIGAARKVK